MTKLYLIRHGQTEWNIEKRLQGSGNSPLTELGIRQAKQIRKRLEEVEIDIAYCSTSERAMKTCEIALEGRDIEVVKLDELKEMNLNHWEGKRNKEIKEKYPELFRLFWEDPLNMKEFPGETLEEFTKRIIEVLSKIIEENRGKNIFIVTHGLVMRTLINYFKNLHQKGPYETKIVDPASLTIVKVLDDLKFVIDKYSDIEHYEYNVT